MNSRCCAGFSSAIPVVSRISPPDSHGVGSCSSEMCTHRTGTSVAAWPRSSRTSSPRSSSRTVSIGPGSAGARLCQAPHALAGLGEHGSENRLDLLELLGTGDERRGQLDDRIPAIVGAADQTAAVELTGQESAQQDLGLLV